MAEQQRSEAVAVRRAARRQELLEAALRAISKHGQSASMEQIAAEAGITKPILYRHFGDQAGLAAALTFRYLDELQKELDRHAQEDLRAMTAAQLDAGIRVIERHPGLYEYITQQRGFRAAEERGLPPALDGFVVFVRGVIQARGLDPDAAGPWAHAMAGMFHHSILWWLATKAISREKLVGYVTSLLWDGLDQLLGGGRD